MGIGSGGCAHAFDKAEGLEMMANKAQNIVVELQDGAKYRMDFDMGALANAECVYEQHFGKAVGVDAIIRDLVGGKAHAVMAFAYGAMMSADEKITWKQFCEGVFTFANYQRLVDTVSEALMCMMRSDGDEPEEGDEKNAHSRGAD